MSIFTTYHVAVRGISAAVPQQQVSNRDYEWISPSEREMLIKTTGIELRRVAAPDVATSDMGLAAAEALLVAADWDKESIDVLVWVSQSPDYHLPATAIVLQNRLQLPKSCMAFDLNLGCSGYVYGLSVMTSLLQSGQLKRGILIVGDKSTSGLSYRDKSTYPLFGDCCTATLLEFSPDAPPIYFNMQSDGSGKDAIIIPDGGIRNPLSDITFVEAEYAEGIVRHRRNLWLDGMAVFNFALREVVPNANALMSYIGTTINDYDYFVFHQANKLMNESIRKKLKLPVEKVPYTLADYGNTSSASIPLTIVARLREAVQTQSVRMVCAAFGVGLSWGSVALQTDAIVCPPIVEI